MQLLARPVDSADAARLFRRTVPAQLASLEKSHGEEAFEDLLKSYLDELAEAQRRLRPAVRPFDDNALLRRLGEGLPSAGQLLAVAESVDLGELERANLRFLEATARFAGALRSIRSFPAAARRFESAVGVVSIGTQGNDRHGPEAALIIDPGGDDVYERAPARDGAVSVIVDLAGNDQYLGSDLALRGLSAIVDLSGDDRYAMEGPGLAAAIAGAALLIDYAGNDTYEAKFLAQGAAAFGIGILVDLAGDDRYRVQAWGQGLEIRGLIGGGIGILRDDAGDDRYEAQMLAHEAGDDHYAITRGYGQGMGLDVAVGVLFDGGGDDAYRAYYGAQGAATANGFGLLADAKGANRFDIGPDEHAWGRAEWLRGLPSVGILLHGTTVQFMRDAKSVPWVPDSLLLGGPLGGAPPSSESAPTRCAADAAWPFDEALVCLLRDAPEAEAAAMWHELERLLAEDSRPAFAALIAIALAVRAPRAPQAARIAALLDRRENCPVRALALRAWPTVPAAQAGLRSGCWRLQAAARAAFVRLGVPLPGDATLPSFLRAIPPQEDTF